jgi:hypothetical protein
VVVVFAIEPRSYRQVMGRAIQALRPHVEVVVIDPDTLEAAVARLDPDLVFANRPEGGGTPNRAAWVEFRPYEQPPARVRLAGRSWDLEEVDLPDLLSIVDRAEEFARAGRDPRSH